MVSRVDLSIVIVNWNTSRLLEQSLRSVYDTVHGLEFEVFVVDNASQDGSQAMVRQRFPAVQLLENNDNLGFARANNQAIRESRGRYILLLNSDAFLTGDAAWQMVRLLDQFVEVGIVGANLFFPDGKPQPSHGPLPTLWSEVRSLFGLDKAMPRSPTGRRAFTYVKTGMVDGACLLVRRAVLDQVGLLDEGFFMFNEEVDLCCRAIRAGWQVAHLPTARVIHIGGGSTGHTAGRILMLYRAKLQYFAKHYGWSVERRLRGMMQLAALVKLLMYALLKSLSFGRVQRDELWRSVAKGLGER